MDTRFTVQEIHRQIPHFDHGINAVLPILNSNFALHITSMSDAIQHECGLAFIRLRKPFSYYQQKYGTALFGLNKLYLLMEKQHNRGQDGAGIAP